MKRMWLMVMVAAVVMSPVLYTQAQEAGGGKPKGESKRPALTDITVSGKISKTDETGRTGKTYARYILTEATGATVMLPSGEGRGRTGDAAPAPAFKLADYVGKDVTITGKGFEREGKKIFREITKIDVAAPAAAPAAAVPAAAPAAAPVAK